MNPWDITVWIKKRLKSMGFDDVRIASLKGFPPKEDVEVFLRWLKNGYHADMSYMEKTAEIRMNVEKLLPGCKYAVVCVLNYGKGRVGVLKFARYSTRRDYHRVYKKVLGKFVRECKDRFGGSYRVFSDSLPILERSLGRVAGIGWIGKNSMLISPKYGSFFVLGGFLTDLELVPDQPFEYDFCGKCTRCVDSCPTGAIVEGRVVDSRRCISYWTIEYKGDEIPIDTHGWIFGCDVCQEVCPWNGKSPMEPNELFPNLDVFKRISAEELMKMDEKEFREIFSGTPIMRAKLKGIKRNLMKIIAESS